MEYKAPTAIECWIYNMNFIQCFWILLLNIKVGKEIIVKGITKIWEIINAGVNINKEYAGISLANFSSSKKNSLF